MGLLDAVTSIGGLLPSAVEGGAFLNDLTGANAAAEKSLENEKSMIDYVNAYNDPRAQMERLISAGLNPNLVYGSGSGGGFVPAQATSSGQVQTNGNVLDLFNMMAGVAQSLKRIDLMQTQESINNATVENIQADTVNKVLGSDNIKSSTALNKVLSDLRRKELSLSDVSLSKAINELGYRSMNPYSSTMGRMIGDSVMITSRFIKSIFDMLGLKSFGYPKEIKYQ